MLCLKLAELVANCVDSDEMPRFATSHLNPHCLLRPVWHMGRVMLRQTGKIMTQSSVITKSIIDHNGRIDN